MEPSDDWFTTDWPVIPADKEPEPIITWGNPLEALWDKQPDSASPEQK